MLVNTSRANYRVHIEKTFISKKSYLAGDKIGEKEETLASISFQKDTMVRGMVSIYPLNLDRNFKPLEGRSQEEGTCL